MNGNRMGEERPNAEEHETTSTTATLTERIKRDLKLASCLARLALAYSSSRARTEPPHHTHLELGAFPNRIMSLPRRCMSPLMPSAEMLTTLWSVPYSRSILLIDDAW